MFILHNAFQSKIFITDLKLSRVLLNNTEIPWILLLPRRESVEQINHLSKEDSLQLIDEINLCSNEMENLFKPDRLNIATIGNKVAQLHIHIISRYVNDEVWPETVWGENLKLLNNRELKARAVELQDNLNQFCTK